ncbi:hypothetical protein NDU88_007347 [Pleurodeles waltl]|uniref:Uncharacterized protein n=1 Tax=Pleurodeles waltl TaxID=8319 RepID=A0AAV7UNK1_PLEWA|nr:hypothetical protein NDU88_007347 [Pleurodeles waltl]
MIEIPAALSYTELAALRPILYRVRFVHNPKGGGVSRKLGRGHCVRWIWGCSWRAHVKMFLGNLRLEDLWADPGRVSKDTVGIVKDQYQEFNRMRVYWELRPSSITHYNFNNVHDKVPQAYLDMMYPELKHTLYIKYRLGVLPLRGYLVRSRRLASGLEFCNSTTGEVDNVAHFTLACKKFDEARRQWLLLLFKSNGENCAKTALALCMRRGSTSEHNNRFIYMGHLAPVKGIAN